MEESKISLLVKIIETCVFEYAEGHEIHIDCLGLDCAGRVLNVCVVESYKNLEEVIKIAKTNVLEGSIHFLSGAFFNDSDEVYDIITVCSPTFEQVSGDDLAYCMDEFEKYHVKRGEFLSRNDCKKYEY